MLDASGNGRFSLVLALLHPASCILPPGCTIQYHDRLLCCRNPPPLHLPTPAERPDADVVIYDGQCGICTAQVRKLPWWDCQGKLSYLSLHDPEVRGAGPTCRTSG